MALTVAKLTPNPDYVNGNKKVRHRTFTCDSSYDTAGEALTPAMFGLKKITQIHVSGIKNSAGTLGWVGAYDYTNQKLLIFTAAAVAGSGTALAEVASTTSLTGYTFRAQAEGY